GPPEDRGETDQDEAAGRGEGLTGKRHPAMITRPSSCPDVRAEGSLSMKIAFIGTGTMGQPMLSNLVKKGHGVVAFDLVEAALEGAVKRGATRAGSAAEAAKAGELAIMVGGDPRDVEEARPVLACLGANIIHVGPAGSGEVAKICNNLIAGVAAVAVSEAFRIAEGFGVDPKILTDVISKSSGNTWV